MTPTPKPTSGALARHDAAEPAATQAPAGPFVINLTSSTTPMALSNPEQAELKRFSFFVSRRFEEGRERFRLHMGYFSTLAEAEEWLAAVRDIYPGAWAGEAPGKKLRERAVAAAAAQAQHAAGPPPVNVPTVHGAGQEPVAAPIPANVPIARPAQDPLTALTAAAVVKSASVAKVAPAVAAVPVTKAAPVVTTVPVAKAAPVVATATATPITAGAVAPLAQTSKAVQASKPAPVSKATLAPKPAPVSMAQGVGTPAAADRVSGTSVSAPRAAVATQAGRVQTATAMMIGKVVTGPVGNAGNAPLAATKPAKGSHTLNPGVDVRAATTASASVGPARAATGPVTNVSKPSEMNAAKAVGTNAPKVPGAGAPKAPGAGAAKGPGTNATKGPGTGAAEAPGTSRAKATGSGAKRTTQGLPNSNVREVLEALGDDESETTGETRLMPAPALASLSLAADDPLESTLTDTQVLRFLETRRADGTELAGVDVESGSISLLKPDDTGTRRALKEAVSDNAPVWFAVQLQWSVQPVELSQVPPLAIFSAYTLYTVEGSRDGRKWFGLRLGFFSDAISAKQVAYYVRSEFTSVAVVPVSPQERDRASDVDKKASVAFPKKIRTEQVDEFKLIDSDDKPTTPQRPQPVATKSAAPAKSAPSGNRRAAKGGRVRARESRAPQTLEETLEILGAHQLEMDNGTGETLNESGVRHLRVEVQKNTTFGRLLERLSERVRKA